MSQKFNYKIDLFAGKVGRDGRAKSEAEERLEATKREGKRDDC